jgi:hypothetical protein
MVAKGEVAERHISAFISKRDEQRKAQEGERRELEDWQITERLEDAQEREARAWAWIAFKRAQIERRHRTCEILDARDLADIDRLSAFLGIDESTKRKQLQEDAAA